MENRNKQNHNATLNANTVLLSAIYLFEISLVLLFVCLYKKGDTPLASIITHTLGVALCASLILLTISIVVIGSDYLRLRNTSSKTFTYTVLMNIISVIIIFVITEFGIRSLSVTTQSEDIFLGTLLLPKTWSKVVDNNRKLLENAGAEKLWIGSYLVYDEMLGWTIGANRRSSDGLSFSSSEGIRSATPDVSFKKSTNKTRIALIGDSYTFGLRVKYEDTWGYKLT